MLSHHPFAMPSPPQDEEPAELRALPEGHQLADFQIEKVLGHGGFGITYLARDLRLDLKVVLKELFPASLVTRGDDHAVIPRSPGQQGDFDWAQERFANEARVLARLSHAGIVRGYRLLRENGTVYQVMEYLPGLSLTHWLARHPHPTEAQLVEILLRLMDGLEALHSHQVLHRDIKPDNIIMKEEGPVVLVDFGSSSLVRDLAKSTTTVLTPGYAPLEQYSAGQQQGPPVDIYALAAVMVHALTGHPPPSAVERMQEEAVFSVQKEAAGRASPAFLQALDRALSLRPEDRPTLVEWRHMLVHESSRFSVHAASSPPPACPPPRSAPPRSASSLPVSLTQTVRGVGRMLSGFFRGSRTVGKAPPPRTPPSETTPHSGDQLLTHLARRPSPGTPVSRKTVDESVQDDTRGPVDCTVFARERMERTATGLLQVFLHAPQDLRKVQATARKFDSQAQPRGHRSLLLDATIGDSFEIRADIEGFELDEDHDTLLWTGQPTSVSFPFRVPKRSAMGQHAGTVWISREGVPLGRISFQIEVVGDARDSLTVPVGNEARHYRSCFCSYASPDRTEMLKRAQGIRAAGYETFIDVLDLRPGDQWNSEIFAAISQCDLFVVIWSQHARQSKWVTKEARYALQCQDEKKGGLDFRPIPIEGPPIATVPRALKGRHFNDKLLGSIRAAELERRRRASNKGTK